MTHVEDIINTETAATPVPTIWSKSGGSSRAVPGTGSLGPPILFQAPPALINLTSMASDHRQAIDQDLVQCELFGTSSRVVRVGTTNPVQIFELGQGTRLK